MQDNLTRFLVPFRQGADGVFGAAEPSFSRTQETERALREKVAAQQYDDYLETIAQNHSIPVMDHEIDRFLALMPPGALILDIGGCWGWHWRRLAATRPDVSVLVIDFVRSNLRHAQNLLGPLVGAQVALMHADATALPFTTAGGQGAGFDGIWTVQVFQHIPDFKKACQEACRVLKPGGCFMNISYHITPLNRLIYRLVGKTYHIDGMVSNAFHLTRASDAQRRVVQQVFGSPVRDCYSECLFHPDLRFTASGRPGSRLGRMDAALGAWPWLARWSARQRGFCVTKCA